MPGSLGICAQHGGQRGGERKSRSEAPEPLQPDHLDLRSCASVIDALVPNSGAGSPSTFTHTTTCDESPDGGERRPRAPAPASRPKQVLPVRRTVEPGVHRGAWSAERPAGQIQVLAERAGIPGRPDRGSPVAAAGIVRETTTAENLLRLPGGSAVEDRGHREPPQPTPLAREVQETGHGFRLTLWGRSVRSPPGHTRSLARYRFHGSFLA